MSFTINQFLKQFARQLINSEWTTRYVNYVSRHKEHTLYTSVDFIDDEDVSSLSATLANLVQDYQTETDMEGPLDCCLGKKRIRKELCNYFSKHTGVVILFQIGEFRYTTELTTEPFSKFCMKMVMEDEHFGVVVPDPPISHTTAQNVTEEKDMSTKTKVSSETTKTSKMLEPLDSTSKTNDNKRKLVDRNTDSDSDSDCIGDVSSDTDEEKKQQKKKVKPSTSYINQDGPTVRDELTRHGQSVSDVAHNFNYFKEVSMKAARYADYMETQFLNFMDMNYKEAMTGRHFSTKVPFNFEKLNKSIKGIKGRHSKTSSSSAQKNPKKPKPKSKSDEWLDKITLPITHFCLLTSKKYCFYSFGSRNYHFQKWHNEGYHPKQISAKPVYLMPSELKLKSTCQQKWYTMTKGFNV